MNFTTIDSPAAAAVASLPASAPAFAPAPALHRHKSSIGLGGLEASISDVLSKGRPAIVAEVERFVAEVDGSGDRRLYAEELVEALYKFFESSTISLAGLDVPAILQNQDPTLVEDVRRCVQGMDADGDGRLTGQELVLKLFEVFAGYKAVAEDRARIAAEADAARTDLSEAVKKLSWWKRVGAGSAVFGSAAFALLFGSNLMANEVSKDTVVEDKSNFLLSKHGGAVKTQTASMEIKSMVPRGEQPPQECRRLQGTPTSPCQVIQRLSPNRRHLEATNPFDELGLRDLQDVGFFDDSAVAAIEGAMGGSVHVKTEDGAESILVKSITHDGDNIVLNGGEAVLVRTHECGSDDEARRLGDSVASGERRLDVRQQAYNLCLAGQEMRNDGFTINHCQQGQEMDEIMSSRGMVGVIAQVNVFDGMFKGMSSFNADISRWDVGDATYFQEMFFGATSFNTDISSWDVGNGDYFSRMFNGATSFNADLSSWDVGSGVHFHMMFYGATAFNQDLSGWRMNLRNSDAYAHNMFYESGMDHIDKCPCFVNGIRACPGKTFLDEDAGTLQDASDQVALRDCATSGCPYYTLDQANSETNPCSS
ncbi:hypothetical protein ACHAWF_005136 [Thalassiosira exigua]